MQTPSISRLVLFALICLIALQVGAQPVEIQQDCVDINTANSEQLQRIIHICPERAGQIIQLRQQRRFETVDQMVRIRGIAAARLADIKRQGLACVSDHQDSQRQEMSDAGQKLGRHGRFVSIATGLVQCSRHFPHVRHPLSVPPPMNEFLTTLGCSELPERFHLSPSHRRLSHSASEALQ